MEGQTLAQIVAVVSLMPEGPRSLAGGLFRRGGGAPREGGAP